MWTIIVSALLIANAFAASNDTCVVEPQMAMCENYQLPDDEVEANINDLCSDMPEMPGCTIDNICQNSKYANDIYCVPFSVYKDLCLDMPMMNGCTDYRSMCNVSSVVLECQTPALPLPSTMDIEDLITSICNQMAMEGCSECTASLSSCDLLTTYSDLCKSMPSMSECSDWKNYCQDIPDWPLCSSSGGNSDPIMRMYFHTGFEDYILFKDWVPRSRGQYVGAWFAVFITGIVFELLRLFRHMCEKEWKKYTHIAESIRFVPFDVRVDVPRAVLRFVEVMLSYSLMLVAMTFNVGLFFAVCAGLSVGTLLFGRFIAWEKQTENASECCN